MNYQQFRPVPPLQNYVRYFWTLESHGLDVLPRTLGPLADGCPGLIYQQKSNGTFYDRDNKELAELFIYGQTIRRTELLLLGNFKTIGICFSPNALKTVFGWDASELTDDCLDLALFSLQLKEQLVNTALLVDQVEVLSSFLLARISKADIRADEITRYAFTRIMDAKGCIPLRALQADLNLSERSFERRFNQDIGISPKLFSKVCRFQASLTQLKRNNYAKLSDIAYDNGYADQSHFIRSFKEFAGFSPYRFQKQASYELADNFPVLM
jgi:AraC-like DNA-binding protein